MGMMGMSFVMMLMVGQGPNELLDVVSTKGYWRLQGVELTAENMLAQLKAEPGEPNADVRRLMAVRALGELRKREALPLLRKLTDSKELFVAEYAKRAIATIEGKTLRGKGVPLAMRMEDVGLLPANCGLVAQFALAPGTGPVDVAKVIAQMGPMGEQMQQEGGLDQLTKPLVEVTGMIGNVRIDAVTVGLAGDVGNDKGFVVVVARGLYDAQRAAAALKGLMTDENRQRIDQVAGMDVYRPDDEVAMILVSNEHFVLAGGPNADQLPVEALAKAIKAGKGTLRDNKELAAIIDATDKSGRMWAAAQMTEVYRKGSPMFEPFHAAALSTKQGKGGTQLTLLAQGKDADKTAAAIAQFNAELANVRRHMEEGVAQMPMLKPMAELVKSIQVKQAGGNVTITAKMPGESSAGMMLAPMMLFGMRAVPSAPPAMVEEGPVEVQPAQPQGR